LSKDVFPLFPVIAFGIWEMSLEMSFLLDEFAQPLSPKPSIFDSKESSPKTESATEEQLEVETQLRSKRTLCERKSEDKFMAAISENVSDFTDPLRSSQPEALANSSDNLRVETLAVEMRYDNRFRNALSSTLLSVSPFLTFPLPYLETEQGRNCKLRKLFPAELYFSKLWSTTPGAVVERPDCVESDTVKSNAEPSNKENEQQLLPAHDFVKMKITSAATSRDIQTKLAE